MWKPNNNEDLKFLLKLIKAGKVKPVIYKCFPLNKVPEALKYLEDGSVEGKIVITVNNDK
jgi:NADPH:quinone reductase-like Zn-dependent oxidoreductase